MINEAREVADEQIRHWIGSGMTAELSWQALTGTRDRNNALWSDVRTYMVRWWLRETLTKAVGELL